MLFTDNKTFSEFQIHILILQKKCADQSLVDWSEKFYTNTVVNAKINVQHFFIIFKFLKRN